MSSRLSLGDRQSSSLAHRQQNSQLLRARAETASQASQLYAAQRAARQRRVRAARVIRSGAAAQQQRQLNQRMISPDATLHHSRGTRTRSAWACCNADQGELESRPWVCAAEWPPSHGTCEQAAC